MNAISSHRPFVRCTPAIAMNQERANDSWVKLFDRIIYMGDYSQHLDGPNVWFARSKHEGLPSIRELCELAAKQPTWSAIINADIIIGPDWNRTELKLQRTLAQAAISRRWQFDPEKDPAMEHAKLTDLGLDLFAAPPAVWRQAAAECPDEFRLGRILWDTWMLGFLMSVTNGNVADLTHNKVVFHPIHGDRGDQSMGNVESAYLHKGGWPQIRV
jgi:hypothetical protein